MSRNSAKRIALATGMVKDEKNLTITEQPEETNDEKIPTQDTEPQYEEPSIEEID